MTDATASSPTAPVPTATRQIVLARRPHGRPEPEDFRLETAELPALADGEVLVANTVMSVDPYMRGRMNDVESYIPPFRLDEPLDGGAVGTVIASRAESLPVGTSVLHGLGWREHAILDARHATPVDTTTIPASAYLGVLGMPGHTAYAGLIAAAEFRPGDTVFVSGAAGAVGSAVGQIAKLSGAKRVIGSAGGPEKVARLLELGFDAAIDYREGSLAARLAEAAPDGVDVYFDNVGGDHLEAAIANMNVDGRIAMCGAIAQYNSTEPTCAPRNLGLAIGKRLTLRGFIVSKYNDLVPEFRATVGPWVASGDLRWDETVREGLDGAPQAFIDLLDGANLGKMVVEL